MTPSLKVLIDNFGPERGPRVRALLTGQTDYREHPAVVAWAQQCYHDPRESAQAKPECLMQALNAEIAGCGVEAIHGRYVDSYHQDIQATYVNQGDTYAVTILHDSETGRFFVTSWGDWVERNERKRRLV